MSNVATAWLRGLAARGVTVTIRNGRLCIHPAAAHKQFTDAEVLTLRHHRNAIKAAISNGTTFRVEPPQVDTPQAVTCPFCYRAPCIGDAHAAFSTLHALDPREQRKREQRTRDTHEWDTRRMYRIPPPEWP